FPERTASARMLLLELDPRPEGISTMRPARFCPAWGWCGSMMAAVPGSMPPHRDSGSERGTTSPPPVPAARVRPLRVTPDALVAPHLSFDRRTDAFLEAAEHHLDS